MKTFYFTFITIALTSTFCFGQGNWHVQDPGTNTTLFDLHFIDASDGWIAGNLGTILHTSDGGATWVQQVAPPTDQYFSIFFADGQHGWAGGSNGRVIRTTDGGNTWLDGTTTTANFIYDLCFVGTDSGWVVGGDHGIYPSFIPNRQIFFTSDGGITWALQYGRSNETPLHAAYFLDSNNGYAVGEGGVIMHTTNGGALWVKETILSAYELRDVVFEDFNTGWIVGYYLGLPHASSIFKTTDGGATWNEQSFGIDQSFSSLSIRDGLHGWAVGGQASISESYILYTSDGGITWNYQTSPTDQYLLKVFALDEDTGWAVGINGALISTTAISCSDVQSLKARCWADSLLQARVVFSSSAYNGETVMFTVDGTDDYNAAVTNQRTTLSVPGYGAGDHTVALTDPAGCVDPVTVRCRRTRSSPFDGENFDEFGEDNPSMPGNKPFSTELLGQPDIGLAGNYPNPFNPTTSIRYELSEDNQTTLKIYNTLGQEVATLVNEFQTAGFHTARWNATNDSGVGVSSGVYVYRLTSGNVVKTGTMLFMK